MGRGLRKGSAKDTTGDVTFSYNAAIPSIDPTTDSQGDELYNLDLWMKMLCRSGGWEGRGLRKGSAKDMTGDVTFSYNAAISFIDPTTDSPGDELYNIDLWMKMLCCSGGWVGRGLRKVSAKDMTGDVTLSYNAALSSIDPTTGSPGGELYNLDLLILILRRVFKIWITLLIIYFPVTK